MIPEIKDFTVITHFIKSLIKFLFALFFISRLFAERSVGLNSLKIGVGAREIGMGLTGVSQAQGGFAIYFNPAIAGNFHSINLNLGYADWIFDTDQSSLFFIHPTKLINFGLGLILFNYGSVELRRDKPEEKIGDYSPKDVTLYFNLAKAISERISLGASLRYFYERIYTYETDQWGIDWGILYNWQGLKVGFSYLNWGDVLRFVREKFYLPTTAHLGVSYNIPINRLSILPAFDFSYSIYEKRYDFSLGSEVNIRNTVFLRIGYGKKSPTFGLGFQKGFFYIDYSGQIKGEFPTPGHHFSLGLKSGL